MMRQTGFGCGERAGDYRASEMRESPGMGGFFSTALNVAGSFVGDPGLGSQIAAQAGRPFARVKETPEQIAAHVAPAVKIALQAGNLPDPARLSQQSQQIAAGVAAQVAAELAAQGVMLPPGTVGGELQHPSFLNAFGGKNAGYVLAGGLALGALLLLKRIA